jgi:hypothetical protein
MKIKILILLAFFAFSTLPVMAGEGHNSNKQKRQNSVKNVNKRNKKALKKWGLAQVVSWEEVQHAG